MNMGHGDALCVLVSFNFIVRSDISSVIKLIEFETYSVNRNEPFRFGRVGSFLLFEIVLNCGFSFVVIICCFLLRVCGFLPYFVQLLSLVHQ